MISDLFRRVTPSRQVLALLLTFVFFNLLATIVRQAMSVTGVDVVSISAQRNSQALFQVLLFLCPASICLLFFRPKGKDFSIWHFDGRVALSLALSLVIFVLFLPFVDWLTFCNDHCHLPAAWSSTEDYLRRVGEESTGLVTQFLMLPGIDNFFINLLVLALLPAFCEELFFRVALQQFILRWMKRPWLAIVLSAAIFSLAHGELFAFFPRFFLGLLLGAFFYYSGNIWANVGAHFLNNSMVVVSYLLYQYGFLPNQPSLWPDFPPYWITVPSTILAALIVFLFFRKRKKQDAPNGKTVLSL